MAIDVAAVVERLGQKVDGAWSTLWEIESYKTSGIDDVGYVHDLEEILGRQLESIGRQLPAALEQLGLEATRKDFILAWRELAGELNRTQLFVTDLDVFAVSPGLDLAVDVIQTLQPRAPEVPDASLRTLEHILRCLPRILSSRGRAPTKESDVQAVLDQHLRCTYADYSRKVSLGKVVKNFRPDGAIHHLRTLIEVKFIDSEVEGKTAVSGVLEDIAGYGGSKDWEHFYAVFYQTRPYLVETEVMTLFEAVAPGHSWKAVVVTGAGGRNAKTE